MIIKIITSCIFSLLLMSYECSSTRLSDDEEITLNVAHYKVPCVGENVQLCYQIKKNGGETEFFYDQIEGFNYEWGFNYILQVEKLQKGNVKVDASSMRYQLKKVISKKKVAKSEIFELPIKMEENNLIRVKNGVCNYFGEIEIQAGKYSCDALQKATSAEFSHAGEKLVIVKLN